MKSLSIRMAERGDSGLVLEFIHELAVFEEMADEVTATEADLVETLFSDAPHAEVLLAFWGGVPAGFAVFFNTYSTFMAKRCLYLEDLFVRESFRRRGIGRALLDELFCLARDRKCGRLEWVVLHDNDRAIRFYESLEARVHPQWRLCRLEHEALANRRA